MLFALLPFSSVSLSEWFQSEKSGWGDALHTWEKETSSYQDAPENSEVLRGRYKLRHRRYSPCKRLFVYSCPCRLYEQLEEVKHQRAVRSRQEDYAKNRLKAKEFHKVQFSVFKGHVGDLNSELKFFSLHRKPYRSFVPSRLKSDRRWMSFICRFLIITNLINKA